MNDNGAILQLPVTEAEAVFNRTITSATIKKGEQLLTITSGGVWTVYDIGHQVSIGDETFHLTEELEPTTAKVEFAAQEDHIDVPCEVRYYAPVYEHVNQHIMGGDK